MTIFLTGLLTCLALTVAIGAQSLFIMRQAIRRDRLFLALAICMAGDVVLIVAGTAGVGAVAEGAPWLLEVLTWAGVAYLLWFAAGSFRSAFGPGRAMAVGPDDGARPGADGAEGAVRGGAQGIDPDGGGETVLVGAGTGVGTKTGEAAGRTPAVVAEKPRLAVRLQRTSDQQRLLTPVRTVVLAALSVSLLNPHAILDTVVMLGTLANSYGAGKWIFAVGALTGSAIWFLTLGLGVRALAPLLDTPRTWKIVDLVVGSVMVFIAASLALG
jgi:L-lysine exporter family protein LysE/ArgO